MPWVDAAEGIAGFDHGALAEGKLRARLRGWCEPLAEAGVPYTVIGRPWELDQADARDLGERLLAGSERPPAILCFSDLMACGVIACGMT